MTTTRTVSFACGNQAVGEIGLVFFHTSSLSFSDFVSSYLRDLMRPTWIGLSDILAENEYAWSDGVSPVLYTNWNDKEPNNAGGTVRTLQPWPHICSIHGGGREGGKGGRGEVNANLLRSGLPGTLRGRGSQPPGGREVERRRLSQGPQLRLLQDEM